MTDRVKSNNKKLPACIIRTAANVRSLIRSLTGVDCDEAWVVVADGGAPTLYTDFRYIPMVKRVRPMVKRVRPFYIRTSASSR